MKLALVAVVLCLAAGCKKEPKEAAKSETGSGSGTASGSGSGSAAPAPQAAAAVQGFAALARTEAAGKAAANTGGIGGALGGIFGGGGGAAAAPSTTDKGAPTPEGQTIAADDPPADDQPAETGGPDFDVEFPPVGAKGGDCAAVTDRLMIIVQRMVDKEMAKLPEDQRAMAEGMMKDQFGEMKKQIAQMCTSEGWSAELRDCILLAADGKALQACEQYAPKDSGGTGTAPAEQPVAAPQYQGGDECSDVAARMRELTLLQIGEVPAESKAEIDKALDEQAAQITEMCVSGQWSQEWRHCVSHAATMDAASQCFGS